MGDGAGEADRRRGPPAQHEEGPRGEGAARGGGARSVRPHSPRVLAGAIGIKIPEPGARRGVLNTSQNILVAFTATGGTPQLSEVNAGAGIVYLTYALAPV